MLAIKATTTRQEIDMAQQLELTHLFPEEAVFLLNSDTLQADMDFSSAMLTEETIATLCQTKPDFIQSIKYEGRSDVLVNNAIEPLLAGLALCLNKRVLTHYGIEDIYQGYPKYGEDHSLCDLLNMENPLSRKYIAMVQVLEARIQLLEDPSRQQQEIFYFVHHTLQIYIENEIRKAYRASKKDFTTIDTLREIENAPDIQALIAATTHVFAHILMMHKRFASSDKLIQKRMTASLSFA